MTSFAYPPGTDPRRFPNPSLRTGPYVNWYPTSQPVGTGSSCATGDCPETPSSCPPSPDPVDGIDNSGCTGSPDDGGRRPGKWNRSSYESGRAGGNGRTMASRGMRNFQSIRRVAPRLPQLRVPGRCMSGAVCGGLINLEGSLALQIAASSTGDPLGVCPVETINSADTVGRGVEK